MELKNITVMREAGMRRRKKRKRRETGKGKRDDVEQI